MPFPPHKRHFTGKETDCLSPSAWHRKNQFPTRVCFTILFAHTVWGSHTPSPLPCPLLHIPVIPTHFHAQFQPQPQSNPHPGWLRVAFQTWHPRDHWVFHCDGRHSLASLQSGGIILTENSTGFLLPLPGHSAARGCA